MRKDTAACVFFLVLTAFPTASLAEAFKCFACIGYLSDQEEDQYMNNKNCPQGSFDGSKVNQENTHSSDKNPSCYAAYFNVDGESLTLRSGSSYETRMNVSKAKIPRMNGQMHGYVCDTSLCNNKNPSAANSHSIVVPLLLLLVAATRFLS